MNQGTDLGWDVPFFPQFADMSSPKHTGDLVVVQEEFQLASRGDPWSSLNMSPVGMQYELGTEVILDDFDVSDKM